MNTIKKSFDQIQKLRELIFFVESSSKDAMIFTGPAGSGKSTILKDLVEFLEKENISYWLTAPTGSAAYNLSKKTTKEVKTLHSQLYQFSKIEEEKPDLFKMIFDLTSGSEAPKVIIIDEASLISDSEQGSDILTFGSNKLLSDLMSFRLRFNNPPKLIFIGDRFQLAPINMKNAPALSKSYLSEEFGLKVSTCDLSEIFRQSDPFLIDTLQSLRHQIKHKDESRVKWVGDGPEVIKRSAVASFMTESNPFKKPNTSAVLAFTNAKVAEYNHLIREGYDFQDVLEADDLLLSIRNMYFFNGLNANEFDENKISLIPNGTLIKVNSVEKGVETRKITLNKGNNEKEVITLNFKDVLMTPILSEENHVLRVKVLLNALTMNTSSLSQDEWRALFVDFLVRNKALMEERKTVEKGSIPHQLWLTKFGRLLRTDPYFNALMAKYGYALTVHKAQGHEWENIIVDTEYRNGIHKLEGLKWLYTACSRTRDTLRLLNKEQTGLLAKCTFKGIYTLNKIPPGFYGEYTPKLSSDDAPIIHQFPFLKVHIEHLKEAALRLSLTLKVDYSRPYLLRTVWSSDTHLFTLDFSYKKKGMKEMVIKQDLHDRSTLYRSVIHEIQRHTKPFYLPNSDNDAEAFFRTELLKVLDLYHVKLCNVVHKQGDYLYRYYLESGEGKGILEVWQNENHNFTNAQLKTEMGVMAKVYTECMDQLFGLG